MSKIYIDDMGIIINDVVLYQKSNSESYFSVNLSFEDYRKIADSFNYDAEAQRNILDMNHVRKIQKKMENNHPIEGTIVLNLRKEQEEEKEFLFDLENNQLLILKNQVEKIFLVDGKHRDEATKRIEEKGKNPSVFFRVDFYWKTKVEEQILFSLLNSNRKGICKSKRIVTSHTLESYFLLELIKKSKMLKGRINTETDTPRDIELSTMSILHDAFFSETYGSFKNFPLHDKNEKEKLLNFFVEAFDYIQNLRKELNYKSIIQKNKDKSKFLTLESKMLIGLVYLISQVYGREDWKIVLSKIMNYKISQNENDKKVDFFSKRNKLTWLPIYNASGKIEQGDPSKRKIKQILHRSFNFLFEVESK